MIGLMLLNHFRYRELSAHSPVSAVAYLQTAVAALVDHDDYEESKQVVYKSVQQTTFI